MARRLVVSLEASPEDQVELYVARRFHQGGGSETLFDLPARPVVQRLFSQSQRLILFMPVGVAVRLLAPSLEDKHSDPAVVCVDDGARFAVSLISGHLGGADSLAQEVAEALGATPVITSASHIAGVFAADMLGRDFGWTIETEPGQLTRASAAVVNGEHVGLFQDAGEPGWQSAGQEIPINVTRYSSIDAVLKSDCVAALLITDRVISDVVDDKRNNKAVVVYRPKTLVAGMGCRKGVPADHLEELLSRAFETNALALTSLSCIATAELKKDEPGLLELAQKYDVPFRCYSADELNSVFGEQSKAGPDAAGGNPPNPPLRKGGDSGVGDRGDEETRLEPTARPRVHNLLGMWGVAEPAALLAAGTRELLVPRTQTKRATVAIARLDYPQVVSFVAESR